MAASKAPTPPTKESPSPQDLSGKQKASEGRIERPISEARSEHMMARIKEANERTALAENNAVRLSKQLKETEAEVVCWNSERDRMMQRVSE